MIITLVTKHVIKKVQAYVKTTNTLNNSYIAYKNIMYKSYSKKTRGRQRER